MDDYGRSGFRIGGLHPAAIAARRVPLTTLLVGVAAASLGILFAVSAPLSAQDVSLVTRLDPSASEVTLEVGESVDFSVIARDGEGREIPDAPIRIGGARRALSYADGRLTALRPGEHELVASLSRGPETAPLILRVPVRVRYGAVTRVEIGEAAWAPLVGTVLPHSVEAFHADGSPRPNPEVTWETSDPTVASVNPFGDLTAHSEGSVTLTARVGGVASSVEYAVAPFAGHRIDLRGDTRAARTGDVIHFSARVLAESGEPVEGVALEWSHTYRPAPGVQASAAPGQIDGGSFVADAPGIYTVVASAGPLNARTSFEVEPRDVVQQVEILGQGRQERVRTTDFWIFEGLDGRDYALTGGKRSDGYGYVWDVTDPGNIFKTDSIQVDARSINDMKVSPDARYATMTREGASNRRNGVVFLDLADPAHPVIASEVTDYGLTGGVHNAYPMERYAFVLADGDKYVILDVSDPYDPKYVGEYNHPNSSLHDVWVLDGLAYSAEWENGLVVVDVGDGRWGGSIDNPVFVSSYPLPTGGTHAVFPYVSESTGKHYVFVGDEIMQRRGLAWEGPGQGRGSYQLPYDPETGMNGIPLATQGYIQIIDFTDPENPEMVARYEVSEYGTHNIWVEDDKLYQAYYEGGLRVVDVSGDLMGNLYTQGREIAVFKPFDPVGYIPNSPMTWSAMPYKGMVYFSDTNSGLWAVKLLPKEKPVT